MIQKSSFCSASAHVVFVAILFIFVLCAQPLFAWAETDDTRTTLSTSASTAPAEQRGTLNLIQSGNYVPEPETKSAQKGSTWISTTKQAQLKSIVLDALKTPVTSGTTQTVDISALSIPYPMDAASRTTASAEISSCISEALNGAPDYFWLAASYSYQAKSISGTWYIGTIKFNYSVDGSTIKAMQTQYKNALTNALKWIPANGTPLQKAKAAHDWLVKNCAYNPEVYSRLKSGDSNPSAWWKTQYNNMMPWSAFGALVGVKNSGTTWSSRQPVCEGYSLAYMSILAHVGVKADFVVNNTAGHGWNRVWLDDTNTKVFHVDVTHDDPLKNGKDQGSSYTPSITWFMKSDSYCKKTGSDHTTWTPSTPTCGTTYDSKTNWETYSANASNPSSYRDVDWATPLTTGASLTASNCTVTFNGSSTSTFNYTGQNIKPTIAIKYNGKDLTTSDFSVTYPSDTITPGTKTITITGKGDYLGSSFTKTYVIRASIADATITAPASVTYNGSAQKLAPKSVVWKDGNKSITLKSGTDYTVMYASDCTSAGAIKCTVKGAGAYTGTKDYSYIINKVPLSSLTVTVSEYVKYNNGAAVTPSITVKLGSTTLTKGTDYTVTYDNNTQLDAKGSVTITFKGNYTGSITKFFTINRTGTAVTRVPMYRLYHPKIQEHFYTASKRERDILTKSQGWKYEGIAWYAPSSSNTPVYRLYSYNTHVHHYTISKRERDVLAKTKQWRYEGIAWYSDDEKSIPLYRLYNPKINRHHYTMSVKERDTISKWGWKKEGIAWYGLK